MKIREYAGLLSTVICGTIGASLCLEMAPITFLKTSLGFNSPLYAAMLVLAAIALCLVTGFRVAGRTAIYCRDFLFLAMGFILFVPGAQVLNSIGISIPSTIQRVFLPEPVTLDLGAILFGAGLGYLYGLYLIYGLSDHEE